MIKPEVQDVEAVFLGVALALKRAGKLTEMSFVQMLEKLEIDESVFRSKHETLEAFENLIFQTEERIKLSSFAEDEFFRKGMVIKCHILDIKERKPL